MLGPSRAWVSTPPPRARARAVRCVFPMLIGCCVALGIRCCGQFGASGTHSGPGSGLYLFDLSSDLTENFNLAGDPKYRSKVTELKARLLAAGADGPPPAYVYPAKSDMSAAKGRVCDYMKVTGNGNPLRASLCSDRARLQGLAESAALHDSSFNLHDSSFNLARTILG